MIGGVISVGNGSVYVLKLNHCRFNLWTISAQDKVVEPQTQQDKVVEEAAPQTQQDTVVEEESAEADESNGTGSV